MIFFNWLFFKLKLSLNLSILLKTKLYSYEILGVFSSAKINPRKNNQNWHP